MKKYFIVTLTCASLLGCVTQEPILKQTASGKPEGNYVSISKNKVKDALVSFCNNKGLMIYSSDDNSVVCGKEESGTAAILSQALIGNANSTTPLLKVKYTISQTGSDVKVWADMWIETQMAMGQTRQERINDNNSVNAIQKSLDDLKP